ncbi:hypothetical protein HNQ79_006748 [Streptomyces candidus]|uniref:Uncharacterized protein n=1 Tax=Streptomyces candidus TaxID=67283 RepID=A0A7X0LSY9_9ACTN|nr:hypothetical protein [Streptomyces candidus]GHH50651.1 hypothetical protein GCM10018773_47960 [Streptomyces candidus]
MNHQQILDLYQWAPGICFQHPARGEQATTPVKTLHLRAGRDEELRACRECVLTLEAERAAAADEVGVRYQPGRVGDDASPTSEDARR